MNQEAITNDEEGRSSNPFSSDSPLADPLDDLLETAPFAKLIAQSISRMHPRNGIVIAINGPWGSGKSTVLNFILYYLEKDFADKQVIPMHFNPWWFSGREDLTRLLISQIRARLGDKDYGELKGKLADFSELVSKIPGLPGRETGEFFADKLRGQPDLASLKNKIDELLRSSNKKILVFIDDIDRLAPEEACDLFRIIKATGNFPNVIYLLAFDIDIVAKSLETALILCGSAQNYLEKIVQVPFALPMPDKIALRKLLFGKLNEIIGESGEELFNPLYWTNIYFDGIDHFITTPRDVIRLTNVLQATYPCLDGEVNSVDFIAIEALRIFMPELYEEIRCNQILLTGAGPRSIETTTNEKKKQVFEAWLELVPEKDRISAKNLLSRIFPAFGSVFGGAIYGSDWHSNWRKELRVCSSDCFPIYFRFSLSNNIISNAEIKALLRVAGNKNAFGDALLEYAGQTRSDGSSRVRAILERMEDYTKDGISEQDIKPIISSLFDIGDRLLLEKDEPRGMIGFGNDIQIGRLTYQLLKRVDETERFIIITSAIREGSAIAVIVHEAIMWGQEHGKFGSGKHNQDDQQTFSEDNMNSIEIQILDRIIKAAETEYLLSVPVPHLAGILYAWSVWAGTTDPVREWVNKIVKTDKGLISLLQHFGTIRRGQNMGDLAVRHKYRLDPRLLEPYVDPNSIAERLGKIDVSALDRNQGRAVSQFLHEHTLMKTGKSPDTDPWDD